eukprot:3400731-Rhodomonas_salina.1
MLSSLKVWPLSRSKTVNSWYRNLLRQYRTLCSDGLCQYRTLCSEGLHQYWALCNESTSVPHTA